MDESRIPKPGRKTLEMSVTNDTQTILEAADDVALADRMKTSRDRMVAELGKVIVARPR